MALPSKELSESALDALIAREQTRIVAPLTEWRTLALQLREEGLLRPRGSATSSADADMGRAGRSSRSTRADVAPRTGWRPTAARWTMRLAAGAALVGGGIVVGRGMTLGDDLIQTMRVAIQDADSTRGHRTVSVNVGSRPFRSSEDAKSVLVRSQSDYQRAAAFLAASDTTGVPRLSPDIYQDRLAALDEMTNASMNALRGAPGDPLLNQYYLSAAAAREATLQQLHNALPAGATLVRF